MIYKLYNISHLPDDISHCKANTNIIFTHGVRLKFEPYIGEFIYPFGILHYLSLNIHLHLKWQIWLRTSL